MPCNSEYMEPSYDEMESQLVCELICFVYKEIGKKIPAWVKEASASIYGESNRLTQAENMLYLTLTSFKKMERERIVYNAKSKTSRRLADWFEKHDEIVKDEEKNERRTHDQKKRAKSVLAKLRKEEVKIIKEYLKNH